MSGTNDVAELRKHLFDAIKGVKEKTMNIEQAKAIADISQVIINSAKVEVDYSKATGSKAATAFLNDGATPGVTTHRIR